MKLCAHPFVEIYTSDSIHYYAPLSKQECFYVPECYPEYYNSSDEVADEAKKVESEVSQSAEYRKKSGMAAPVLAKHSMPKSEGESTSLQNEELQPQQQHHLQSLSRAEGLAVNPAGTTAISSQEESSGTSAPNKSPAGLPDCDEKLMDLINPASAIDSKLQEMATSSVSQTKYDDEPPADDLSVVTKSDITGLGDSVNLSSELQDSDVTSTAFISDDESDSDNESSPVTSLSGRDLSSISSFSPSGTSGTSSQVFSGSTSSGASGELSQDVSASSSGQLQDMDAKGVLVELSSDSEGEAHPAVSTANQVTNM